MNIPLEIPTAEGVFVAHYSEHGLARMDFPSAEPGAENVDNASVMESSHPLLGERAGVRAAMPSAQIRQWHNLTTRALKATLAGRAPGELPPLDLSTGTQFQQSVWQSLLRIGFGRTLSYQGVASDIGKPKATRAVGGACGANPIPVLVPCHRVLAANHALGGFTSGLGWKRKLLACEGIAFR